MGEKRGGKVGRLKHKTKSKSRKPWSGSQDAWLKDWLWYSLDISSLISETKDRQMSPKVSHSNVL